MPLAPADELVLVPTSYADWDRRSVLSADHLRGTRALLGQVPEPVLARRKFRPSPSTVSQWVGDGLSIGEAEDVDQAGRAALLLASTLASASKSPTRSCSREAGRSALGETGVMLCGVVAAQAEEVDKAGRAALLLAL